MASSSVNPLAYPWVDNGNDTYEFSTEDGLNYEFYFTEGATYFEENPSFASQVKMFGFHPTNYQPALQTEWGLPKKKLNNVYDIRIEITLVKAIKEYFNDPRAILTYVCLQGDGRQAERHRRFNIMFLRHFQEQFIKKDIAEGPDVYASIIFRKENPFWAEIEDSFTQFENK